MNKETLKDIETYFDRLWPLLRSITGEGVRKTHDILNELVPLERMEIPTGTQVLDWKIPQEWVVKDAYVITPDGKKILDVWENNLHLMNYSIPFSGELSRAELDKHLYSIPEMPEAIPYVTSYYVPRWGFCLSEKMRSSLPDGQYKVVVDTKMIDGNLTLSHAILPGETDKEVLISTYTCHPSMANNELSGPLLAAFLYRRLASLEKRKLTYRFVFVPETIGAIAYLHYYGKHLMEKTIAGYVATCVGNCDNFTYKKSRRGQSLADKAAILALKRLDPHLEILDFFPSGSDERQYCSPGFDLPVGSVIRSLYSQFSEYHTSLDNKEFISFDSLQKSIDAYFEICCLLDKNTTYKNLFPYGEPMLSKRNLDMSIGSKRKVSDFMKSCQWLLNLSDGEHSLLDISIRSGQDFHLLYDVAQSCLQAKILEEIPL